MKFLQNKFIILATISIFITVLVLLYFYGYKLGVVQEEASSIIVNAILMLLATFIGISLPLYANSENERQRKNEELKTSYISIARYVGEELADNIIQIEDLMSNNKKTIKELKDKLAQTTEEQGARQLLGVWKAFSDDLLIGLEDINHRALIMSGVLTKLPDNVVNSEIKLAYSKMANLKQRLRRISFFFGMILLPPPDFPKQVIMGMLKSKVPESIKSVTEDINIFIESARGAIKKINKIIEPYGKEIKIVVDGNQNMQNL
ncbi:hypothetical protein A2982_00600 [candidate division WWE3 bacterium RIFCSPLOWO2_01_FULL_39_13]|uniref:Uncharacterized protein n=1 Tax=candidate division WWE3 bacterium RIFCSPLOWO2_01_FULL_39_13 TaxID=1802624 RepID=A0A1F4V3J0_UNCKA|nr:MAG: hypothetical protein A2982_00600 [candidate division WWE3 bacterium RIFCSPLOWO2_01_FULL_39_13]